MKRILLTTALLVILPTLGGCAKKQILGNLYEGIQMQKRQATPPSPSSDAPPPAPGYDEYLRQRQEAISESAPTP